LLGIFLSGSLLAAPDEDLLGRKQGYPVCPVPKQAFAAPECLVGTLGHYDQVFPARVVRKGGETRELKRAPRELALDHSGSKAGKGIDAYLANNRNTGLLVMKGDTVLAERYQYRRTDKHRLTS